MKTRYFFLTGLLFLLFITGLQSQDLFWLRAGGNYARVTGVRADIYTPQSGYLFGAGYEKIFSNPFGIKLEMNYYKKGFRSLSTLESNNAVMTFRNEVDQSSLAIPLFLTMHLKRFYFELGLSWDYLLSSHQYEKETINYVNSSTPVIREYYDRHELRNPERTYMAGVGLRLTDGMHLSARYVQGLTPLGVDYLWTRMSYFQVSLNMRLGKRFDPVPLGVVSSISENGKSSSYRVISHQYITNIDFNRMGDGNQINFRWRGAEVGNVSITNVSIVPSSGYLTTSGNRVMIADVTYPVTCNMRYTVTHNISRDTYESLVEFRIDEAGIWTVTLQNH